MVTQEFLTKIPIFNKLSVVDLDILSNLWHQRAVKQGDILFRKGDTGSSMFIIQEGTIEISIPVEQDHKDIRVSVLSQGDFFGELSLIDGLPRTATATATHTCQLLEMNRDDFIQFLMSRPSVAISMISEIGKRLQATNDLVTSLASKNVNVEMEERLSFGNRLADKVTDFVGSWTFLIYFLAGVFIWCVLNFIELIFPIFDPYPFIFLNLVLAVVASLQAPLIMMSQNRAQIKDRLRAELDYQINLKSELMLQQLHTKIDEMRVSELQMMQETLEKELAHIRRQGQAKEVSPHGDPFVAGKH